jgi:hypothetical protein
MENKTIKKAEKYRWMLSNLLASLDVTEFPNNRGVVMTMMIIIISNTNSRLINILSRSWRVLGIPTEETALTRGN